MAVVEVPKLITEAHDRWLFASTSESAQRAAELDDLNFDALRQWPADIVTQRAGDAANKTPARPCLTISLLGQPTSQIDNAQEQAQFTPTVKPKNSKASKKNAEIAKGLLRHIQSQSHALENRMWGAKRANRAGRGYWRIVSRYCDDPDVEGAAAFDQDLYVDRILNQFSVYFDPNAKQPNKSDAQWVLVTEMITEDAYRTRFDKGVSGKTSKLQESLDRDSLTEWADIGTTYPGWVSTDAKGSKTIRIADYIRIEATVTKAVLEVQRGATKKFVNIDAAAGEKIAAPTGWKEVSRREIKTKRVKWDTINAIESLKVIQWPGQYLPVIEMIIEEKNVDGERIYQGLIRAAKDAQRSYNYMRSAQVETIGLAPRAPFTADMRAIGQYKTMYDRANIDNYAVLPYDSVDAITGDEIPNARPGREVSEPAIQAVTVAAQVAVSDIRATTMVPEVALGQTDPRYRSKGSVQALQGQSDLATSGFLISLRNAVAWEAQVLLDLIPHYYDRPGRIISIMSGEPAAPKSVMLGQHFTRGEEGTPEEADPNTPGAEFYDLTAERMTVEIAVGKAHPTQMAEQQADIIEMMGTSPQVSNALAPLAAKYSGMPGADEVFNVLKQLLWPPAMQGGDEQQPSPMQLQQMLMQMGEQNKQLMAELQQLGHTLETKQIESNTRIKVAEIQAASTGAVAETKANTGLAETIIKDEAERAGIDAENARTLVDAAGKKLDHAHESALQHHAHAHEKEVVKMQPKPEKAE